MVSGAQPDGTRLAEQPLAMSQSGIENTRPVISGTFFRCGPDTFYVKGVTYGTFAPAEDGSQYPTPERVDGDSALMSARGFNAHQL